MRASTPSQKTLSSRYQHGKWRYVDAEKRNYISVAFCLVFWHSSFMSKSDKLLERFLSKPSDFKFSELKKLLVSLGYREMRLGKTAGSRVAFINESKDHIIRLHKPHPRPVLKKYQVNQIIEELQRKGNI
jgi:hypothetical protein